MAPQDFDNIPTYSQGTAFNPLEFLADVAMQDAPVNTTAGDDEDDEDDANWVDVNTRSSNVIGNNSRLANGNPAITAEALSAFGIQPADATLVASLSDSFLEDEITVPAPKRRRLLKSNHASNLLVRRDFFDSLAQYPEILMELAKHLRLPDLISLYAISKDFHATVNGHLSHIMKACAAHRAPESARIFLFTLYDDVCVTDPVGRPHPVRPGEVRRVPSLRWLAMVLHREKCVRDILACMAREGHRMPKTMSLTLKKMWLTMDISTSARRVQLMHNEQYWTDNDIYNVQMFLIKLDMRFNDPIDGPADDGLKKLMLGQKGLTPLCRLLKREQYTSTMEIIQAAIRYSYRPKPQFYGMPIFGVPANEIGRGHLEGWGAGNVHLYRMDEMAMREACRRNLGLDDHMMMMCLWGYVDPVTKENIRVSDEEMYMSDDEGVEVAPSVKSAEVKRESDSGFLHAEGEEWETEDEDMPNESMLDDNADAGTIGRSGWRRNRGT